MIKKILNLVLLTAVTLLAQVDRSKMPEPGAAPEIKIGEYESFEIANGLKVFVVENHKLPRVAFSLVLHRDAIMEKENMGYVSITGRLLRTGTTNRTKDELDEAIDFIGASLFTSSTSIYASSLTKHTETLLELMSDVLFNPSFKQEELDKIKKQSISGLKAAKEEPSAIANNVRKVLLYGKNHPYGELETEETVESITIDMCKNYYETYFHPNIAYLAIVGDITKADAEKLVKKYFGNWKPKEVPTFDYPSVKKPATNKVALVDRPNAVQSSIRISYPIDLEKFGEESLKASIMNYLLGGGASGDLFQVLREEKGYTYGAYSSLTGDKIVGSFSASCDARNEVTDSAVATFLEVMEKFKNKKVSEEKLQAAKNYMTGSFSRSLESSQTVARFALNIARYNLSSDYYKTYLQKLNAITVDDIYESAQKYITPNNAYIVVVGKADEVAEGLQKFSQNNKVTFYDNYGNEYDPSASTIEDGVTAKTVIDNYIAAIGGRTNIEKVKDKLTSLKGSMQGMEIKLDISKKAPNKYLSVTDAGMMKQQTIFDGTKGKMIAMGNEKVLEGDDLFQLKLESTLNLFLDYESAGITPKLTGMEKIDGKDVYVVALTLPNGKTWINYYEKASGLLVKESKTMDTPQGAFTQSTFMKDYKEVEGVKYPFKLSQSFGPQIIELEVTSIRVNSGLDDGLFEIK
ncbi:MAG: insulinase family protein [Melioribacteraceae bacterium]|nr:insulinase family protein [Melioribacteraceae bacterium]